MNKLRSLRALYGMNQIDLANMLRISVDSYKRKEAGKIDFKLKEVKNLIKIFALSSDDVYEIFFTNELHKTSNFQLPILS